MPLSTTAIPSPYSPGSPEAEESYRSSPWRHGKQGFRVIFLHMFRASVVPIAAPHLGRPAGRLAFHVRSPSRPARPSS